MDANRWSFAICLQLRCRYESSIPARGFQSKVTENDATPD